MANKNHAQKEPEAQPQTNDAFRDHVVKTLTDGANAYAASVLGRGCSLTSRRAKSVVSDYISGANHVLQLVADLNEAELADFCLKLQTFVPNQPKLPF